MELESRRYLTLKNSLYKIALASFITMAVWIGFEIYWSYRPRPLSPAIKQQTKLLRPNLDIDTINSLSSRHHITPQTLLDFKNRYSLPTISPSPPVSPAATASSSALQLP